MLWPCSTACQGRRLRGRDGQGGHGSPPIDTVLCPGAHLEYALHTASVPFDRGSTESVAGWAWYLLGSSAEQSVLHAGGVSRTGPSLDGLHWGNRGTGMESLRPEIALDGLHWSDKGTRMNSSLP